MKGINENPDLCRNNFYAFLFKFFQANEGIRIDSRHFLYEKLKAVSVDPQAVFSLSGIVMNLANQLKLSYGDRLYQKAFQMQTLASPEALKGRKNPYALYARLQEALKNAALFFSAPPVKMSIGEREEMVVIDVRNLRKAAVQIQTDFTFQDLPHEVKPDSLVNLFKDLNQRIDQLPAEQKKTALSYIAAKSGPRLDMLEFGLIGPGRNLSACSI